MASMPNPTSERDPEDIEAKRRVWDQFRLRLDALQTYDEAMQLVAETPPPNWPGRQYYLNLGFFLYHSFAIPHDSNHAEQALYMQFIQRLDAAGVLKPGVAQEVEDNLRRAMETQKSSE
jgi:hypothetical protein